MFKLKNELIDAVMKTLSIDSVQDKPDKGAPFGKGNREALDYVLSLCDSFGMKTKMLDGYCGYADIGEGETFGILGHLDTVPIGKGWDKNPYGEISDGVIYGRGAMDDKGPMMSCLFALKSLLDEGLKPKRKIRFIFGSNEESGWGCIDRYNKTEVMPEEGFSPDADFPVINCEKGIVNYKISGEYGGDIKVTAGERANVVPNECTVSSPCQIHLIDTLTLNNLPYKTTDHGIEFTVSGVSAHAARPWEGENAAIKAFEILSFDKQFEDIYNRLSSYYGEGCGLDLTDEKSGRLSINLGIVSIENNQINLTVDIRYPVTFTEMTIFEAIKKSFSEYEIIKTHEHPPLYCDKNSRLVQSLLLAYRKITGEKSEPITIGGGTYARALKTGVAFGPQFPDTPTTIHQPNERVSIEELIKMTEIYREAIKSICF